MLNRLPYSLVLLTFASTLIAQESTPSPHNSSPTQTLSQSHQEQFAPYWTAEGGWHTELQLRNNLANEKVTVLPALRTPDGAEHPLKAVTILPGEVQSINLNDALGDVEPGLVGQSNAYGSIVLRYTSYSIGNVYGSVMVHDTGRPIMYHIDAVNQAPGWLTGSREGIWWLPTSSTRDYLILTNQSDHNLQATLWLYDAAGKSWNQPVQLAPRQTERLLVRDLVSEAGLQGTYGGIKVDVANGAGSLDTAHILFDETAGFSATMKMFDYDPKMQIRERDFLKSGVWTTRAPMLALSNPDPVLEFPKYTVLQPQLLLRNTTNKPAKVYLSFHWRGPVKDGRASIPELILVPFETRKIDVKSLQDKGTLPEDAYWAQVTLSTNTLPNEVMAVAASYDSTLRYGAQTPFSDQLIAHLEGGQWQADSTHTSLIAAGNGGSKPVKAALTFFYDQGRKQYRIEQIIAPNDQLWVNLNDLIRNQMPDNDGNIIPSDITSGAYQLREISQPEQNFLYEGKVITDKTFGHATYGCMVCCGYGGDNQPYLDPNPVQVPLNGSAVVGVVGINSCSHNPTSISQYFPVWSSSNTSILTVSPDQANGIMLGSATITASATALPTASFGETGHSICEPEPAAAQGTGNVPLYGAQVILDNGGYPTDCPTTGMYVRQMQMQIVKQKQPYAAVSIVESISKVSANTCNNGPPSYSSQCQAPSLGLGPSGNGQFLDTMSVSQAYCSSGITQSSGCGYSSTSTWSMCGALTNSFWHSPRIIHSNGIKVNGQSTDITKGTILY